jgi:thiamine transport system permease protein
MSFLDRVNKASENDKTRKAWFYFAVLIFVVIILIPAIYVVIKIFTEWDDVSAVWNDSSQMDVIWGAVGTSFGLALVVTLFDIVVGLPMAWIMVRKEFKGKGILDSLLDMPLAFPTAVLGLSVLMFWGCPDGVDIPGLGFHLSPFMALFLLHVVFTYPYMVRSLSGILEQIEPNYETAAMTLGASRWTAVRTITLPLFRTGLVTGFILCFARSLSETGGTQVLLTIMGVKDSYYTGPTYISLHKSAADTNAATPDMILISVIMILIALALLLLVKYLIAKFKIPGEKVFPEFERKLSHGAVPKIKDGLAIAVLIFMVLIPAFYVFTYLTEPGNIDTGKLARSICNSFLIAGVAVIFDVIFGIPLAMYIARNRGEKFAGLLDNLMNVPLIVPTTALGVSLYLFWDDVAGGAPDMLLVILGHISFTYPLVVRNIAGAVEEVDPSYEETALTLGAKHFQTFYKVLLPMIKNSVIAGAIMAFTRSLGETGATVAIAPDVESVPVYIVHLVEDGSYADAAMASMVLIVICFVLMLAVRKFSHKEAVRRD